MTDAAAAIDSDLAPWARVNRWVEEMDGDGPDRWVVEVRAHKRWGCQCEVCRRVGSHPHPYLVHRRQFRHRVAEYVQYLAPGWFYDQGGRGRAGFDNVVRRMRLEMDRFEAGDDRGLPLSSARSSD